MNITDRIRRSVRGRTDLVFRPVDFLAFGSEASVKRALAHIASDRLAEWNAIHNKLAVASMDHNALAHLTAVADFQSDNTLCVALAPRVKTILARTPLSC